MRPYLAVVKDSFRAAMASWVLYIMLVLITLFLLVILPVSYKERLTTRLYPTEVIDPGGLMAKIVEEGTNDEPSPERRIWTKLDKSLQDDLLSLLDPLSSREDLSQREVAALVQRIQKNVAQLIVAIDGMLDDEKLYDEKSWENVELSDEANELLDKGIDDLSREQIGRLNRLLVDATFRGLIRESPETSMQFTYAWFDSGQAIPVRKRELARLIHENLPWFLDKFVFSIGLFIAILVTAPIIPQMFEPGSIHLLLSKPVSRWALFLSKFLGGCAFTLLCAAYLFTGLFLIFGLRLDIWHFGILLGIPVYVFVFAIYYTVSAMASVLWRNSIVAVVMAILFWLLCFSIGLTKQFSETGLNQFRLTTLIEAGDDIICVDETNCPYAWDESANQWKKAMISEELIELPSLALIGGLPDMSGPVYDEAKDRLLAIQAPYSRPGMQLLIVGQGKEQWRYTEAALAPLVTTDLMKEPDGSVIAISRLGTIHRLDRDPIEMIKELEKLGLELDKAKKVKDADEQDGEKSEEQEADSDEDEEEEPATENTDEAELDFNLNPFVEAGPSPPLVLNAPSALAMNKDTGALAAYNRGTITLLAKDASGIYERAAPTEDKPHELSGDEELKCAMAFGGKTLLVARSDGTILALDGKTLETRKEFKPEKHTEPRFVSASPEGRWFAIVFHNRNLWLLDTKTDELKQANVTGQGDISGVAFTGRKRLLVADRTTRVSEYLLDPERLDRRFTPSLSTMEWLYRYAINPIYFLCPKPGEFHNTVTYLLTSEETRGGEFGDAGAAQAQIRPWTPVWNGLIFMAVMLGLGCFYIERQEF